MKRTLARLATVAASLPIAACLVAGATAAHASDIPVTLPGCWGGGSNGTIYCDITLTAKTPNPSIGVIYVKACAMNCYDVPVQWVDPHTPDADLCYSYKDGWGNQHSDCGSDISGVSVSPTGFLHNLLLNEFGCGGGTLACAYE